ncbi:MAG: alpha/beta hydrolase [Bacteroidales bacterium]|nr:alpha/beta hydrolase [Bacteroidales bacterium]
MKKIIVIILLVLLGYPAVSQQESAFYGSWSGKLSFQGQSLRMVFHIQKNELGEAVTKLDSPDQGAFGLSVQQTTIIGDRLELGLPALMAAFEGTLTHPDTIVGKWKQAGIEFDLKMHPFVGEKPQGRPQEPIGKQPYHEKKVSISHEKDSFVLAGTLTIPSGKGPFPAAVLISGSGPQNRDEEIMGHKPFLVLADFLTKQGIVVLRYDDRGTGESGGVFATGTTYDFADDAENVWDYLRQQKEVDPAWCGLIGHSEGGMIAPIVASRNPEIGFIVLMAAPGTPSDRLLIKQARLIAEGQGASESEIRLTENSNKAIFEVLKSENDLNTARVKVSEMMSALADSLTSNQTDMQEMLRERLLASVDQLFSPWFLNFIRFDPAPYLGQVKCPVLAINGEKDRQVPAVENLDAIEQHLQKAGNKHVKVVMFDGLNHLFQTAETGSPAEYATIEETMAPQVLAQIADWINQLKK